MSPSYSAWSNTPIKTYYTAIQISLYGIDSFAPIPLKIGPLDPFIGPNDPRGVIFALGNMRFHKPGSDRDLWVLLKFCHQGGARGPLLPTWLDHYNVIVMRGGEYWPYLSLPKIKLKEVLP